MKKLLIALIAVATIVSCGKNNQVSSGTAGISNPITTTVSGASQLGTMVDNYATSFGNAQSNVNYYSSYNQLLSSGANLKYLYTKTTSAASNSNCTLKWGIVYVCSYSSGSTSTPTASRTVENNSVTILAKQNELKALINSAIQIQQASATTYYIYTNTGKYIALDTRYPIQAQPVQIQDSTGNEYLFNITL